MVFPRALPGGFDDLQRLSAAALASEARHPSQLYELLLEGVVLFALLWWYSRRPRPRYAVAGLFALLYGLFRFAVEFVREPDVQMGYIAFDWLTMGQLLSLPLIAIGLFLLWLSRRSPVAVAGSAAPAAPAPPASRR
jgi:phosphatidylglycerol:prolipoprotein diacylglycerol transferase